MEISCTKKLLDLLGETAIAKSEESSFYNWHAHIITKNRRKMLVLLNDQTHYVIILFGIRASELKNLPKNITDAIKDMLHYLGYNDTVAVTYLQRANEISYVKTNRSLISSMNQVTQMIKYYPNDEIEDSMLQYRLSDWLNKVPVKALGQGLIFPRDEFRKAIEEFAI